MPKKICVVVTARPSYSRIKSALIAIDKHPELELQLVVAASALLDKYGTVTKTIEADGFKISARVMNVIDGGNLAAQAKTTGLGIIELASVFDNLNPDAVVTIADRFETMSTAIAASYLNIPLVHIQGGEITGNIDEKVRHAITKLSDLHLVASAKAKERVIKMGEIEGTVYQTGCPSIDLADEMMADSGLDFDPYEKYGGVGGKPVYEQGYLVVMQHPVTTEFEQSRAQAKTTLNVIADLGIPTFWFWPNVDAGASGTANAIRSFRENKKVDHIHFFKNMEPNDFLKLIKNSKCLIGNSSVGIRESGYLGIPVVNIGTRQDGRERGQNVIDVTYDTSEIIQAVKKQINCGPYQKDTIYGTGNAGNKIADILASHKMTFHKKLNY